MCCGKCNCNKTEDTQLIDKVQKAITLIKEAYEIYKSLTKEEKLILDKEMDNL